MDRVLEELLLVIVLLLDVGVNIAILSFLVLDKKVQTLVDCDFKLLVIISVLNNLIYGILIAVDLVLISPNCVSELFNRPLDDALRDSQVFNQVTERSID